MWLTHLRFTIHTLWWRAMGWVGLPMAPGERPFRSFPTRCVLCGRLENPYTKEQFIAVFGEIIEKPPGYDHPWMWFCKSLNLVQPTGVLCSHHRFICHRHGTFMRRAVIDCLTNVQHSLSPQPRPAIQRWSNRIHEACYWLQVTARFVWSVAGEMALMFTHPYRYYKWVKFTYD